MKKKELTENEKKELKFLAEWCIEIRRFEYEKLDMHLFFEDDIDDIKEAEANNNLKGLRMAINDVNEIMLDISNEQLIELNSRLKERFGKTLYDFQKNTDKKIAQIIKRRKIRNEDEFRLAQMHIDRIFQDTEKEEEWKILEDLCFEFEQNELKVKS